MWFVPGRTVICLGRMLSKQLYICSCFQWSKVVTTSSRTLDRCFHPTFTMIDTTTLSSSNNILSEKVLRALEVRTDTPAMKAALERCGFKEVISSYDSALMAAGCFGLSAFPGAASTHFFGKQRLKGLVLRGCGAAAAFVSLPWCWLENVAWRRPAIGLFLGRRID